MTKNNDLFEQEDIKRSKKLFFKRSAMEMLIALGPSYQEYFDRRYFTIIEDTE